MINRIIAILLIGLFILYNFSFNTLGDDDLSNKRELSSINTEKYDLVIITPLYFVNSLYKLAEHKRSCGIETKIIRLEDIYRGYYFPVQGRDRPEQIKFFIKGAMETWSIKYVLLVGGSRQLPVRYINNLVKYPGRDLLEPPFISDLYYADIYDSEGSFSSWDTNGDGVFGEWKGKTAEDKDIDLKPDIYLGRLPCKNKLEVKTMVNKIINYERNTYGKSWFKNMVVVGGDTYPKNDDCYEGELDTQEALNYMKNFNHVKLWASTGELAKNGSFKIIKAINKGCGFLFLAGHGNPPFWGTHKPNDKEWISKFSIYHMSLLTNRDMLPVCIINGCRNSAFDTRLINLLKHPVKSYYWMDCIPKCWTWALTSKITGGAIATLGSSGIGFIKWDKETGGAADGWSYLSPRFFWEYGVNGTDILGEIWGKVIIDYLDKFPIDWNTPSLCYNTSDPKPDAVNAKTVEQFILFGDPTLKIGGYATD